jgi:hypothetical protein
MYTGLHIKHPLFSSGFTETCSFLTNFLKIFKISNLMKICPLGAELLNAEGWMEGGTDRQTW